ncbi:class I SAM-dependent DNA methyltransferase, partial [Bacteroidota bacterium]
LLDEDLNAFPYVDGKLFEESLLIADFNTKMRETILECSALDWSKISPAIFGSLFQSVKNPEERRNLGAHYTSEKNIMKLIKPLFLDELNEEFEKIKGNKKQLMEFHRKLSKLKFLDPACGCGNFLVITYRELRILELKILKMLYGGDLGTQQATRLEDIVWINIDQFNGIEIDEWPARISEVAMWLIDHQMNMMLSDEFGHYFVRLPLEKPANIHNGNALRMDWEKLIEERTTDITADVTNIMTVNEPMQHYHTVNVFSREVKILDSEQITEDIQVKAQNKFDYILGNPPFVGKQYQGTEQKVDMDLIFNGIKGAGVLDYVTAWYIKASQLIQNTKTKVAFVSSNSISQGEQVGILWNMLFKFYNIKIHFAHRTFRWSNEAKNNAHVLVVIIGFANYDTNKKFIFEYDTIISEPQVISVKNINPYLVESDDLVLLNRNNAICKVPKIVFGSMPNDGGHLLLSETDKNEYLNQEPEGEVYIREFTGGAEFIKSIKRYCFWLKDSNPEILKQLSILKKKISSVKDYRIASKREGTRKLAEYPALFGEIRQPDSDYILIPNLSSGMRTYIPMGFKKSHVIASNLALIIPNANVFHFGILTSIMHMTWIRNTCGMLSTSLRYSNKLVYNNYPWPWEPSEKNVERVKEKAQLVLDTREKYPDSSLADLYDPLTMPPDLVKAHKELDRAVDLCYRPQKFVNESGRLEYLFELYKKYTQGMFVEEKKKKRKR